MVSLEFAEFEGLAGDYPDSISLERLRAGIPLDWEEQLKRLNLRFSLSPELSADVEISPEPDQT